MIHVPAPEIAGAFSCVEMKRRRSPSHSGSPRRLPEKTVRYRPVSLSSGGVGRGEQREDVLCANCGRGGHSLAICRDVKEPFLKGCPHCNDHADNLDECPHRPSLTDSDLIDLLIMNRANTVMIYTGFDWLELFKRYADDDNVWGRCRGFPHTLGFAQQTIENARHYLKRGTFVYGKDIRWDPFTKDAGTIKKTLQRRPGFYHGQTSAASLIPRASPSTEPAKAKSHFLDEDARDMLMAPREPAAEKLPPFRNPAEPVTKNRKKSNAETSHPSEYAKDWEPEPILGHKFAGRESETETLQKKVKVAEDRCKELERNLEEEKANHEATRRRMEGLLDKLLH